MFDFKKQGMTLLEVVKAYPEQVAEAIQTYQDKLSTLNLHIIEGANGMCRCGKDGKSCMQQINEM